MNAGRYLDDLALFRAVARHRSFTRAAAELAMSTSNLSHAIRRLETSLGVRLLQRNSRSVAPSPSGEALLTALDPALHHIEDALDALQRGTESVSGTLRLTATREGYESVLRPVLRRFTETYPNAAIEVLIDYGFRDIIADGFDAGIRLGEKIDQDMIAVRLGGALRMAVVASPSYLSRHGTPGDPRSLAAHRCINYRMVASGVLYRWEFERDDKAFDLRVAGPLTFNEPGAMLDAALDGLGIAYVLEDRVAEWIARGALVRLLEDWTPPFPGFFLYHPSRRQPRPVLEAFIAMARSACPGV